MPITRRRPDELHPLKTARSDLPAGLVVFLVALPLCLGIALASGAPLMSGIVAGILGGLVVPIVSRSPLSVSGPAAGLAAIVLAGIEELGTFNLFLTAVVLAGLLQIGLGIIKAGGIGALVPSSVIKGMLAAIGLILILKQLPHAVGYDVEAFGADAFVAPTGENTFSLITHALGAMEMGAALIAGVSLAILIVWPRTPLERVRVLPAALVVVLVGAAMNHAFGVYAPELQLEASHLVSLPAYDGPAGFWAALPSPEWAGLLNPTTWSIALTIALVASVETLLCVEAVDGLDPYRRPTPTSRELLAQGIANTVSGLVGGLPITSVIVRSSANLAAGGKTRMSAVFHGIFLLGAVLFLASYLTLIPLASLAAILLVVGYKLVRPGLVRTIFRQGYEQYLPFAATVIAILLTDLLRGVLFGLVLGLVFVLRNKTHNAFTVEKEAELVIIRFNKDISFIHEPALVRLLRELADGTRVRIDATASGFIDFDIKEKVQDFVDSAPARALEVELVGIELDHHTSKGKRPVEPVVRRNISAVNSSPST